MNECDVTNRSDGESSADQSADSLQSHGQHQLSLSLNISFFQADDYFMLCVYFTIVSRSSLLLQLGLLSLTTQRAESEM